MKPQVHECSVACFRCRWLRVSRVRERLEQFREVRKDRLKHIVGFVGFTASHFGAEPEPSECRQNLGDAYAAAARVTYAQWMRGRVVAWIFLWLPFGGACGDGHATFAAGAGAGGGIAAPALPRHLELGVFHSCVVLSDGSGHCWGGNNAAQIGDGTINGSRSVPVKVVEDATAACAGFEHSCAIKDDGTLACWGGNLYGQLGFGDAYLGGSLSPRPVIELTNVVDVSCGFYHTCAVQADGVAWCWGQNHVGQLGGGSETESNVPVRVEMRGSVAQIAAGQDYSCAVTSTGELYCWGSNLLGTLGTGSAMDSPTPVLLTGITEVVEVRASNYFACARRSDGSVWCWGDNGLHNLGTEDVRFSYVPLQVSGIAGATGLAIGSYHVCVALNDGSARCWGGNSDGELGANAGSMSATPVVVENLPGVVDTIAAGGSHSCSAVDGTTVWCWGDNFYGQLGNGSKEDSVIPVRVGL